MKKAFTKTAASDVPELKRARLGKGVRGKYLTRVTSEGSTVVLQHEIQEGLTTAETAYRMVGSRLTLAQPTRDLSRCPK